MNHEIYYTLEQCKFIFVFSYTILVLFFILNSQHSVHRVKNKINNQEHVSLLLLLSGLGFSLFVSSRRRWFYLLTIRL